MLTPSLKQTRFLATLYQFHQIFHCKYVSYGGDLVYWSVIVKSIDVLTQFSVEKILYKI